MRDRGALRIRGCGTAVAHADALLQGLAELLVDGGARFGWK